MSRATSIIEINGTSYDAATGNVVGAVSKVASQVKDQAKVIDGFVRKSGSAISKAPAAVIPKRATSEARPVRSAKQIHSRTQRSHALMRQSVGKPNLQATETNESSIKKSGMTANPDRRERAHAIAKDARVERFGILKPAGAKPKQAIVAKARPMNHHAQSVAKAVPQPLPSMVVSASHQRLERMLDEALIRADAHKEMMRRRSRNPLNRITRLPRWLVISVILVVLILLVGFFAWRNIPQVAVKVAGEQAHVSATFPAYAPSGFSVAGSISHQGNSVVIKYHNQNYTYDITQTSSSWDSTSLAANAIAPGSQVQTSQVQGTTVYIYGQQNNATWVNNGVWYKLQNHASLTSDQILKIVQSM